MSLLPCAGGGRSSRTDGVSGDHLHNLLPIRDAMRLDVMAIVHDLSWQSDTRTQLLHLLHDIRLPVPVARFIYVCTGTLLIFPSLAYAHIM